MLDAFCDCGHRLSVLDVTGECLTCLCNPVAKSPTGFVCHAGCGTPVGSYHAYCPTCRAARYGQTRRSNGRKGKAALSDADDDACVAPTNKE